MKNKKKWIMIGTVVLVAVLGIFVYANAVADSINSSTNYLILAKSDLVNSISAKGIVESTDKSNVYSTLAYQVKEVNVEVGDVVNEGDVLAILDTEDLRLNIAQQRAELETSEKSSENQVSNNQRLLAEAQANLSSGKNPQISSAQSALSQAEANLKNAQKAYDDLVYDNENNKAQQITTAKSNLESAKLDFDLKTTQYENTKSLYDAGAASKIDFDQAETNYLNSKAKYDDAAFAVDNAQTVNQRNIDNAKTSLETANTAYNNAKASLSSAKNTASQDVSRQRSSLESAQISSSLEAKLISIEKLEKNLKDSTITAPCSGTITAVYAKEGGNGQGLLFIIEDTSSLKISTKFKEYDVAKVEPKMEVVIRSDATGDDSYDGEVKSINPAAIKNAQGETASTDDVEFASEVLVLSKDTNLKIGMNTRLTVVLENKPNVYAVPYDTVSNNKDGSSSIFIAVEDKKDVYIAKEIKVNIGMETDFYVEIESDLLSDDMKVITDAENVKDGMSVTLR